MYFGEEKICLITGANSGIGKAAAIGLARLGAKVIIAVRNHNRGEKILKEIVELTGNKNIELAECFLSSIQSIHRLSDYIKNRYKRLDILINNAGAYFSKRHVTEDGFEATFMVNYLSRFILTNSLTEALLKCRQGRIINVCGESHRNGKINFSDLQMEKAYKPGIAYCQSKLADLLFTYEAAGRLVSSNITVNALHPGTVKTNLIFNDPDAPVLKKIFYKISSSFFKSPEKGAETIIYLASSPEVAKVTGGYFIDRKSVKSSPDSYNEKLAGELWEKSIELWNPADRKSLITGLLNAKTITD